MGNIGTMDFAHNKICFSSGMGKIVLLTNEYAYGFYNEEKNYRWAKSSYEKYYEAHREKRKAYYREHYKKNKEARQKYYKEYYARKKEAQLNEN